MIKNIYQGKFIVFEGLDGSGQSTQAALLKDFLIKKGKEAVLTKEPTIDSQAGKKIKNVLEKKEEIKPLDLQKLFAEDRKWHLEKIIIPALKKGRFVISDRYFFSSFAYGASEGLDLDELIKINDDFILPDLTIFLEVSPYICIQRIEKRGIEKTLFEREEKLKKVLEKYKILLQKFENCVIIDGEKSIPEVFKEIQNLVLSYFFKNN